MSRQWLQTLYLKSDSSVMVSIILYISKFWVVAKCTQLMRNKSGVKGIMGLSMYMYCVITHTIE